MGPVCYQKKFLNMGQLIWAQIFGFYGENPENREIFENGPIFQENVLKMGTLFCQNHP